MFSDIVVGYNKNDFLCNGRSNGYMPSESKCEKIMKNEEKFDYENICRIGNEEQRDIFNNKMNSTGVLKKNYVSIKTKYQK